MTLRLIVVVATGNLAIGIQVDVGLPVLFSDG